MHVITTIITTASTSTAAPEYAALCLLQQQHPHVLGLDGSSEKRKQVVPEITKSKKSNTFSQHMSEQRSTNSHMLDTSH
jgi:hypothetical protein